MDNATLAAVLGSLREQETGLLELVEAHRLQLQEEQGLLNRVRNAIKALEEPEAKEQGNKKPAPTKAAVQKLVVAELEGRPKESGEAIRDTVKSKLVEAGYSLAGYSLRFDEAWGEVQKKFVPT